MSPTVKKKPGRPPDPTLRDRRQEEILDAAATIFARQGYPNTDMQVVADALQIAKGTIYRYFPSKEALFLAAVDRGMRRLHDQVNGSGAGVDDPLKRLTRAIRAYLVFFKDHPEFVELLIQERAEFKDRKKPTYYIHRDANVGPWREVFRGLIAQGRIRNTSVDRILDVVSDLVYGTMFNSYFTGQGKPLEVQVLDVIDIVFHGILSDNERASRVHRLGRQLGNQGMALEQVESSGGTGEKSIPGPLGDPANFPDRPATESNGLAAPSAGPPRRRRRFLIGFAASVALACLFLFGLPWLLGFWSHVSTDDAFVSGHVTMVSPRAPGVVDKVLVEDNDYVEAGTVLVQLDGEPYRLGVEQKRAALARAKLTIDQQVAALEVARADTEQARNQVRAQVAGLRGGWFLVKTVQDFVHYQAAALRSDAANLKLQQASLTLAQAEYDRTARLVPGHAVSKEEVEQKQAALDVARQQVEAAEQKVQQSRALLGLKPDRDHPEVVPDNLEQTFAGVQYVMASGQQTLAQLGVPFDLFGMAPSELQERLHELDSESLVHQVPTVQAAQVRLSQAQAALGGSAFNPAKPYDHPAVLQAQKELEEAELQLSYTQVKAPVAGFVSQRSVNPGNHVELGQTVLAIRPLQEVWIDANFKETQLEALRIGQPVGIHVDAYPGRVFHGRVSGFSSGTGAALSLLPPENATGNFVKVVQRLPVRIDLTEPNPPDAPLFAGLSVVPEVDLKAEPTGPYAGQRLRQLQGSDPVQP